MTDRLRGWAKQLRSLVRKERVERELDDEIRFHIEMEAKRLRREVGLSEAEARRRAVLAFGGVERFKEAVRDARWTRWVEDLARDVRYSVRSLWRTPGFAAAAVLTLALGVGANTAVFSLVSATLFRPLPFDEPDRIVTLYQTRVEPGAEARDQRWAYPEFEAVRSTVTTFSHLAAYYADDANLSDGSAPPVRVRTETVSASYFSALGVRPTPGRDFLREEDGAPGAHPVMILAHDLWERRFDGSREVIGRQVRLNGVALTVVGVAPEGFRGLTGSAQVWIPQAMAPDVIYPDQLTSMQHFLSVVGRIRPEASLDRVRAEAASVGLAASDGVRERAGGFEEEEWSVTAVPLEEARRDPATTRAHLVLAGAVFVVLLIALVNLSGLLLARSIAREREMAVRAALGGGRGRLVRHVLAKSGVLGLVGGVLGVLLAVWGVHALVTLAPDRLGGARPRFADLAALADPSADWRVLAFAGALALAAALIAGLAPALRATREDPAGALRSGSRGNTVGVGSIRRPTLLSLAAVAQVAFALVLLVAVAHLLQGFHRLRSLDPGFEPQGLVSFRISPPMNEYRGDAAVPLVRSVLERVKAVPGVRSATVSFCTPFMSCSSTYLNIEGRRNAPDDLPLVGRHYVAPDHFRTLGIPLLRGRGLTAEDRAGRRRVAVINETAARRFWPGDDPIGKRVWFESGGGFASPDSMTEIVGVAGDVLYGRPGEEIGPDFYTSYLQFTWPETYVIVRAAGDPLALVPSLRSAVAEVDPDLPIHDVRALEERGAEALAAERFATVALAIFAGLGLLLASLGIYGIMAYSVAQRRREIGIRLALGSTPREVLRFIMGQGFALSTTGLVIGAGAALAVSGALPALIADVGSIDPRVFGAVVAFLLLVALVACYLPARAAARVNPVKTIAVE